MNPEERAESQLSNLLYYRMNSKKHAELQWQVQERFKKSLPETSQVHMPFWHY